MSFAFTFLSPTLFCVQGAYCKTTCTCNNTRSQSKLSVGSYACKTADNATNHDCESTPSPSLRPSLSPPSGSQQPARSPEKWHWRPCASPQQWPPPTAAAPAPAQPRVHPVRGRGSSCSSLTPSDKRLSYHNTHITTCLYVDMTIHNFIDYLRQSKTQSITFGLAWQRAICIHNYTCT